VADGPHVHLVFDRFEGFETTSDVEKARRATMVIAAVFNAAEFRCRVLSFDASQPVDQTNRGINCLLDASRRSQDGSLKGFFWGTEPGSSRSVEDYGDPMTNRDVYAAIMKAAEPQHPGEPDGLMHLSTGIRSSLWHPGSIGVTDDSGVTRTNSNTFRTMSLTELVGHWSHEYSHVLRFKHEPGHSAGRPGSVPYAVGLIACQVASAYVPESYTASDDDQCIKTMRGL
jgi:hypothetical protein